MKKVICFIVLLLLIGVSLFSQVAVNTDGSPVNNSAILDVKSVTKGLLQPQMTHVEMNAVSNPADGLLVYCTDCGSNGLGAVCMFIDVEWFSLSATGTDQGVPCPGTPTVDYGGKTYNTVLIGSQCWFKENFNIGTRINGIQEQTNNAVIEKYCYDDLESNCDKYGGLYQWNEWMNYTTSSNANPSGRQGICPIGWHVPSDAEYCQMETFLDPTVGCGGGWIGTDAGGKMKETGTSHWSSPNTGATNISGYTALPGGYRNSDGGFTTINTHLYSWSASENSVSTTWGLDLYHLYGMVGHGIYVKQSGFSGRCVKD